MFWVILVIAYLVVAVGMCYIIGGRLRKQGGEK